MIDKKHRDPYTHIGFLIWIIGNIMSKAMTDNYPNSKKIPFTHMMVLCSLYWLINKKENINQKDLSDFVQMKETTISSIVRSLNKSNLIDFSEDKTDKRAKIVKISKKGSKFIESFLDLAMSFENKINMNSLGLVKNLKSLVDELSIRHR